MRPRYLLVLLLSTALLGSVIVSGGPTFPPGVPWILVGGYTNSVDSLPNYVDRRNREKEVFGTSRDGSPREHQDFALIFWPWPTPIPNRDFLRTLDDGVIPYVFFNARYSNVTLREIANGKGDGRIIEVARYLQSVVATGQDVWFSWYDEPEVAMRKWKSGDHSFGEWANMTGDDYAASWDRVRTLFEEFAPGVTFGYASLNSDWTPSFFPAKGDADRLDFVASSQFAWDCPPEHTFREEVLQARTKIAKLAPGVPHVIDAVAAGKGSCADTAAWIRGSVSTAQDFAVDDVNPLIAYGYWDAGSMVLDSKPGAVRAWRGAVRTLGCPAELTSVDSSGRRVPWCSGE
jgi:hypothetical protein